ncbi:hypothetical protein [Pontibacter amylolyticus]|uniref:Lipoprotein n=1 Tax=Pontibacter amylolyticus TaxID=1424080 RepID=A0ABQ1W1G8_9BACT|nr:hypothetical protein [Pontibacter amylolyticus]GGG06543.1 hypothetical protein GCM10011323_09060 [Pontibacter amylolyticus]
MKKVLVPTLVLLMLSCSGRTSEQVLKRAETENSALANSGEVALEKDSTSLYTLEPATEEDFRNWANHTFGFAMNRGDARKVDGVITLKISGEWKPIAALKDTLSDKDDTAYAAYKYLGQNKELNKYLVAGHFYEHYETYLVDMTTGEIAATSWTEPAVSPDLSFLANLSTATIMDNAPNGIQVWKVTEKGGRAAIEKYFEINQQDWEAFEMVWESPRSIIIKMLPMEQFEMLSGVPKKDEFSYLRLRIK